MTAISIPLVILAFLTLIVALIILALVVPVELSFLAATEGLQMKMEFNFNVILGLLSGSVISEPEVSSFELRLLRIPVIRRRQREEDREKEEEPNRGSEGLSGKVSALSGSFTTPSWGC